MNIPAFFSATYIEAREKFLAAFEARSLDVKSHLNPNAKGSDGEELYMDVTRIGLTSATKILVVSSATHGGEGFCGSGLQVGMLNEGFFNNLPEDTAVLIIHAINPYGFSHVRRVNEDNIDLNRNFRDYSIDLPDNLPYREVHDWIVPADWDGPAKEAADTSIANFIEEKGMPAFQAAVTAGQHIKEDGIFFGGKKASWSNKTLCAVIKENAGDAEHLALLDIHTGLGPYGYGELIYVGDSSGFDRAMNWYDDEVTDPSSGTSTSAEVFGTMATGICQMSPNATHTCVAVEYGTLELMEILNSLRADNWLYIHGDITSDLGKDIKQKVRDAFYCDADDWKEMIWKRGISTVNKALAGLAKS